ncbi:hypothetical protein KP509_04G076600 [Ceratopteris richardii]|uniref:DEUBAD domain-containing protein n=1 Tax=Ceratopteris richardii TaxID=49495 RepID=A0A8T2UYC1_CERRI|nr:hypothetical protein KP509_04G076600 [Ceratopteris richardii]
MALWQQVEKRVAGGQAQPMHGIKHDHISAASMKRYSYTCNTSAPTHTTSKGKQQTHSAPWISQQASLDVAIPSNFWKLRPHVSLDYDAHRQKVVPKRNQVSASWRHLSLRLQWKKHERTKVADVFEVPPELFELKDLREILSLEAWKECLSLSERRILRQFLPEGIDNEGLVRTILRGDNFYFGNPLEKWASQLLRGDLHPDVVEQKESELKQAYDEHYVDVHNYHHKMLETLKGLKEEWMLCKSKKKRLRSSSSIGNLKNKRQNVANFQPVSGVADFPSTVEGAQSINDKLDINAYSDGCTPFMHVLKVSRKQYNDILDMSEGKMDELFVATLSPFLSLKQKLEIAHACGCDGKAALDIHKHWSKLVVAEIPAAYDVFSQRKTENERLAKLIGEQCIHYFSALTHRTITAEVDDSRNPSASESSITCLDVKTDAQAPVESCLSSADCANMTMPQHLIQEEHVSLIDLPNGSSLAAEGHATLLTPVRSQTVNDGSGNEDPFDGCGRSILDRGTLQPSDADTFSECNESCVRKCVRLEENTSVQGLESSGKDHNSWGLHSKPGSEVVNAAAASGESEEVEQRVSIQSVEKFDASSLISWHVSREEPVSTLKYASRTESDEQVQHRNEHERDEHTLSPMSTFPFCALETEKISHSELVNAKNLTQVFGTGCSQAETEQNNQMMLHMFLDDPKPPSNGLLGADMSSSHNLQGQNGFCEQNEVPSLVSHCIDNAVQKDHEPITELSLLVDNRNTKYKYQCEQAESVSSRTSNEYLQQNGVEQHWMTRPIKGEQLYAFHRNARESHHLMQSNQDICNPQSFTQALPSWASSSHGAASTLSHPNFINHWNVEENVTQNSWIPCEGAAGSLFLSGKGEFGRPISQYWDQVSFSPYTSTWPMKLENSLVRANTSKLHDDQTFQGYENWGHVQSQPINHLPYTWGMDNSGRIASYPWRNSNSLLSSQYDQHKLQDAFLSKLNSNFTTS